MKRRHFLGCLCALGLCNRLTQTRAGQTDSLSLELNTEDRIAVASMRFKMGYHCSQAGLEPELALRLASALAGGSTVGGECGAVASGYLVLGLRHGRTWPAHGNVRRESELWDRVRRFVAEFRKRHGAITCRELLGIDVFAEEGWREAQKKGLFTNRCPQYVRDVITILDELG